MKRPEDVELAPGYSVGRYREMEAARDRGGIAVLIKSRFTDRYLAPMLARGGTKHGFSNMAIGCLMLEALESFRRGWPDTRNRSEQAFCSFFDRHQRFASFRGFASRFYRDVRCGILH